MTKQIVKGVLGFAMLAMLAPLWAPALTFVFLCKEKSDG